MKLQILSLIGLMLCGSAFSQNYISGTVSLHGPNTGGGTTTVASGASFLFYNNTFYEQDGFINLGDSTTISADTGTLAFNGSAAQTVTGRFKLGGLRLMNAAGVTITNSVSPSMITILDSVSFGSINSAILHAGDSLMTLRSTALKTARIADLTHNDVNNGNTVAGKVEVERFIQGKRAWRLLCPPTTGDTAGSQTIKDAWQEGATAARGQIVNPHPGYGTVLSRPGNNPASATGYDDGIQGSTAYSLRMFTKDGLYTQPANTDQIHFSPHAAYMVEIRGDRSVPPELQTSNYATTPTVTNLRSKGQLINGSITSTVTNAAGNFAGVANPYACTIDFSKVGLTGVTNGFYVWDPTIGTLGAWVYIDGTDNYTATPVTPAGVGTYTNTATNPLIQSGQAILIKSTGSTGSLTFKESNKNPFNRVSAFRETPFPSLNVSLCGLDSNKTYLFMDGTSAVFDESFSKAALPDEDISKPGNLTESISFYVKGNYMIKEKWPMPAPADTLSLPVWKTTARKYRLVAEAKQMSATPQAYLVDKYKQTSTAIPASSAISYDFDVTGDAASKALDRFIIVFESNVLPVTFTAIKAYPLQDGVNVEWNVQNESNMASYEVEKSTDGKTFSKLGTVASGGTAVTSAYHLFDTQPANGDNYYRVKSIGLNGDVKYTSIVKATFSGNSFMTISVYPNPVKNRNIKVVLTQVPAGQYLFTLYSNDGKKVAGKSVIHAGGTNTYSLPVSTAAQGIYHLQVRDGSNKVEKEIRVIIE